MTSSSSNIIGSYDQRKFKNPKSYDPRNPRSKTLKQADDMVEYLANKFGSSDTHRPFYRKVAWKLPDDSIRRIAASVIDKRPNNPRAYFVACVKREKEYYGN